MLKRAHKGVYHKMSAKHRLQRYVDEFAGAASKVGAKVGASATRWTRCNRLLPGWLFLGW